MKRTRVSLPPPDQIRRIQGALRSDTSTLSHDCKWQVFAFLKSPRVESLYGSWAVGSAFGDASQASAHLSSECRIMSHREVEELYESLLEQRWVPFSNRSLVDSFDQMLVRDGLKGFRSKWPGHTPPGGEFKCDIKPVRRRPLGWVHQLHCHRLFWKSTEDHSKGTIWLYLSQEGCNKGGISGHEEGLSDRIMGIRKSTVISSGVTWEAIWADGVSHRFKASPQTNRKLMAAIASRWSNPPEKLQREQGRPFALKDLKEDSHSYVYLVRLMTFDETGDGRLYFKIGKAVSVPKRIKQFGPCELVDEIRCASEAMSLRIEAALHTQFDDYRKLGTEIFILNSMQLEIVRVAFQEMRCEVS